MARSGKSKISEIDKMYFREIFNLHQKEEKIDYKGLCAIFEMVDFKPNDKQEEEFKEMFNKKPLIGFNGMSYLLEILLRCRFFINIFIEK